MHKIAAIPALLAVLAAAVGCGAAGEYIYVKEVTMRLSGDNATFELNYTLEAFTRLYVLALGCRYLEPELLSLFGNYTGVKLMKADMNSAALQIQGAGKYQNGLYLFDSRTLGSRQNPLKEGIGRFTVVYPEGRMRTFYNITSTQSVFCPAKNDNPILARIAKPSLT
jgi:hypothetical protein